MKILQLGTKVSDIVSGTKGMLTHFYIEMDMSERYIFQPKGINPTTGQPVGSVVITKNRVKGGIDTDAKIPLELLGNKGEDIASGFKGTIIGLTYHINGCIHADIKPKGTLADGSTVEPRDFDIRRIKSPALKPLTSKQLQKDIVKKPSPTPKTYKR